MLPQRITKSLVKMLKKHHPLWMSIHVTHPRELTPEVTEALARLADAGIPLGSQTVLLKGINDDAAVMKPLMHGLLKRRVKPYYLYQCDPIRGSGAFPHHRRKGHRDHPGAARPHDGLCDADVLRRCAGRRRQDPRSRRIPSSGRDGDDLLLRNFEGDVYRYPDPGGTLGRDKPSLPQNSGGIAHAHRGHLRSARPIISRWAIGEEETAEFDSEITIAAICDALDGARPRAHPHRRHAASWPRVSWRASAGMRVFNICEGLKGVAREAQVPALLEAYDIPYVFSDPLTLSLRARQGDGQARRARLRACRRRISR